MSCKRLIPSMGSVSLLVESTNIRTFLQTSVPFVPNLKVFVGATGVLGLKQFHASVGLGYFCCLYEMLEMVEGGIGGITACQMATVAPSGQIENDLLLTV